MPLANKLLMCIVVLVFIPLMLVGLYLNGVVARLALASANDSILQTLKQSEHNFRALAADADDISIRVLSNDIVQQFLKSEYETYDYDKIYLALGDLLDGLTGSKRYYKSFNLYSAGGDLVYHWNTPYPDLNEVIMEHASRLQGKGFWITTEDEIAFYRAVMDFNKLGRTIGYQRFVIDEEALRQFYANFNSYAGSQIFLLDQTGLILSSTEREMVGRNIGQTEHIRNAIAQRDGYFRASIDEQKHSVLFFTVEETDWTLVQSIPEKGLTTFRSTVNWMLIVIFSLCFLFVCALWLVIYRYVVKPLQILHQSMAKVKTGNFKIDMNIESRDEIGEISNGFLRMVKQLEETINDVYISRIKQREAELNALESQINPHFLYNTLDSIRWLAVQRKNYDVSEQVEALADIFRHALNKGENLVTIRQELDFLDSYMLIQHRKYGNRIALQIEADPMLMNHKMPKLVLQPLVENAIVHGLDPIVEGGTIKIKINRFEEEIRFIVSDNGVGTDEQKILAMMNNVADNKHVFALKNIDDRIKLGFGPDYGLRFTSKPGAGTTVEVRIPVIG